jgi:isopentenyldiphosphate isomerase
VLARRVASARGTHTINPKDRVASHLRLICLCWYRMLQLLLWSVLLFFINGSHAFMQRVTLLPSNAAFLKSVHMRVRAAEAELASASDTIQHADKYRNILVDSQTYLQSYMITQAPDIEHEHLRDLYSTVDAGTSQLLLKLTNADSSSSADAVGYCGIDAQSKPFVVAQPSLSNDTATLLTRMLQSVASPSVGSVQHSSSDTEMVDWVDTASTVLCSLDRATVHTHNILHRGAGILVHNSKGDIYCHQRTHTKRVFPGLYDMFVGGVAASGEPLSTTALRELQEELSLGNDASRLRFLFNTTVSTALNRCVVAVYEYVCGDDEAVAWQESEVAWGAWLPFADVVAKVDSKQWEFVPDGLQVWNAYLAHMRDEHSNHA